MDQWLAFVNTAVNVRFP